MLLIVVNLVAAPGARHLGVKATACPRVKTALPVPTVFRVEKARDFACRLMGVATSVRVVRVKWGWFATLRWENVSLHPGFAKRVLVKAPVPAALIVYNVTVVLFA